MFFVGDVHNRRCTVSTQRIVGGAMSLVGGVHKLHEL